MAGLGAGGKVGRGVSLLDKKKKQPGGRKALVYIALENLGDSGTYERLHY